MLLTTEIDEEYGVRLAEAAKRLGNARALDEVIAILCETTRDIVCSDGIALVLRKDGLCHYVAEDAIEPLWRGAKFPVEECVSGWAMLNRQTVVIPDLELDPRVPKIAYARTSMRSLAMVPMGSPEPVAALGAYWCAFVEPDATTVRRLEILAQVATIALGRLAQPAL